MVVAVRSAGAASIERTNVRIITPETDRRAEPIWSSLTCPSSR
jgi:hypothetical protein